MKMFNSVDRRSCRRSRSTPSLGSRKIYVRVCKTRWAQEIISDFPTSSAISLVTTIWNPKIISCILKLGEVSDYSAYRRVVWRSRLISLNGKKMDSFWNKRFKFHKLLSIPSLLGLQFHTCTYTFINLQLRFILVIQLCSDHDCMAT